MRVWFCTTLTIFLLTLASIVYADDACEATEHPTPAQALERADLVFFGRVSSFFKGVGPDARQQQFWEFEVEGVWKGPSQPQIRIYARDRDSDGDKDSCDMSFEVGNSYLVYAYLKKRSPNRYRVRKGRTTLGDRSLRDLLYLGDPPHRFE